MRPRRPFLLLLVFATCFGSPAVPQQPNRGISERNHMPEWVARPMASRVRSRLPRFHRSRYSYRLAARWGSPITRPNTEEVSWDSALSLWSKREFDHRVSDGFAPKNRSAQQG